MTTPAHIPPRPHVHGMVPPSRPHHGELSRPLHLRDPGPCHHTHDHGHRSDARTHRPKGRPWPRWHSCTEQCHGEPSAHCVRAPRLFGQASLGTVVSCLTKASENVARDTITADARVASSPSPRPCLGERLAGKHQGQPAQCPTPAPSLLSWADCSSCNIVPVALCWPSLSSLQFGPTNRPACLSSSCKPSPAAA